MTPDRKLDDEAGRLAALRRYDVLDTAPEAPFEVLTQLARDGRIQSSRATVDLKARISSAMASAGVLQPRVFLGLLFIRTATSLS